MKTLSIRLNVSLMWLKTEVGNWRAPTDFGLTYFACQGNEDWVCYCVKGDGDARSIPAGLEPFVRKGSRMSAIDACEDHLLGLISNVVSMGVVE